MQNKKNEYFKFSINELISKNNSIHHKKIYISHKDIIYFSGWGLVGYKVDKRLDSEISFNEKELNDILLFKQKNSIKNLYFESSDSLDYLDLFNQDGCSELVYNLLNELQYKRIFLLKEKIQDGFSFTFKGRDDFLKYMSLLGIDEVYCLMRCMFVQFGISKELCKALWCDYLKSIMQDSFCFEKINFMYLYDRFFYFD